MNDVAYVAIIIVFFVLSGLFVMVCDRIVGPDEVAAAPAQSPGPASGAGGDPERLAA